MRRLPPGMTLLLLLALFILPLVMAWMMFNGTIPFSSKNTRNLGRLVVPVVPLDWSGVVTAGGDPAQFLLDGFWVVLHILPSPCPQKCQDLVTRLKQVHIASGQNFGRIKIALLVKYEMAEARKADLLNIYPRFNLITHPSAGFSAALRTAGSDPTGAAASPVIYLVDPLGNIMMTYNGEDGPNKLYKDLTRLLTWSKLDKRS